MTGVQTCALPIFSVRQNQMFGQIGSIEAEARKAAAAYAAKVNALKVNIEALRLLLQAGCEPRERSVIITFDPSAGIKTYYDASDTGKTTPLGIHKMEPDDYVLDLPL